MAGAILDAGIDELLLEGGDEVKPARRIERGDGAAQNSRGQHSQGLPSVLRISPRMKCSGTMPSAKSTRASALMSGTTMRSPPVPNGVSRIGPKPSASDLESSRCPASAGLGARAPEIPCRAHGRRCRSSLQRSIPRAACVIPSLARHGHLLETPHHCHGCMSRPSTSCSRVSNRGCPLQAWARRRAEQ